MFRDLHDLHLCRQRLANHDFATEWHGGFGLLHHPGVHVGLDYDRIGHLAQGFVPAILAREVLLRRSVLSRGGWLFFLVTSVCLAVSAFYELIEWWSALAMGEAAKDFLGTQGDPWDTQADMFSALVGAVAAQLVLGRLHDRQLVRLASR